MSLAFYPGPDGGKSHPIFTIALGRIGGVLSVRSGGIHENHVALLKETAGQWPPVVVWGDECLVVDGAHRVEAARQLGFDSIPACRFDGSRDEAFVESLQRNLAHGLPLTMDDRRGAAARVLSLHADWSDRRIAAVCGLSSKTVARVRHDLPPTRTRTELYAVESLRRIGRDGRARPERAGEMRERIKVALAENPGASLRAIARVTGASPETVRTVRLRLADEPRSNDDAKELRRAEEGSDSFDARVSILKFDRSTPREPGTSGPSGIKGSRSEDWARDAALLACGDEGEFARWFESHRIGDEWHGFAWVIPVSRVFDVVDEARRRASAWTSFASLVESRIR